MKIKIFNDIKEKFISHFQHNNRNYSIYKINELSFNLIDEDEIKVRKRLTKFNSLNEIFCYLKIEE